MLVRISVRSPQLTAPSYAAAMSVSSAQQALKSAVRAQESAHKRHSDAHKKQGALENEIGKLAERAAKASSESMAKNYLCQVEGTPFSLTSFTASIG